MSPPELARVWAESGPSLARVWAGSGSQSNPLLHTAPHWIVRPTHALVCLWTRRDDLRSAGRLQVSGRDVTHRHRDCVGISLLCVLFPRWSLCAEVTVTSGAVEWLRGVIKCPKTHPSTPNPRHPSSSPKPHPRELPDLGRVWAGSHPESPAPLPLTFLHQLPKREKEEK